MRVPWRLSATPTGSGSGVADDQESDPVGSPADGDGAAVVTPDPDGPLLLRGSFRITDVDGNEIPSERRTVALCRCGRSALKPFCDGSHRGRFSATGGDQRPAGGRRG
jgi:CDGSH-type Zn-finger protein